MRKLTIKQAGTADHAYNNGRMTESPVRIYLVGGAVRDKLLKRPVVDYDRMMVGALLEELLASTAKWWRLLSLFFVCPGTVDHDNRPSPSTRAKTCRRPATCNRPTAR